MCGIAGIYRKDGIADEALVEVMAGVLAHRGPDDDGVYAAGPIALAHRRLSILDLSSSGRQPMGLRERGLWIVYNGEVYNYLYLRSELKNLGYSFFSNTDTEVILKGYDAWGEAIFGKLRGMFALAIWNANKQDLILARDPFGIKPLYYTKCGKDFVFGSELKSLRIHPDFTTEIDPNSLFFYLRHLYIPEPRSIYAGVFRLPAGHLLRVNRNGQKLSSFCPHPRSPSERSGSYEDTVTELKNILQDSVRAHLISDVPLGVFLSGGVDSSAIVALMRRLNISTIKTFTISFEGLPAYDEGPFARKIAKHFQTDHHEILVRPDITEFVQNGFMAAFDEPFANPSAFIADSLSAFARKEVKVALCGLGGDEFFGGYPRYNAMLWRKHFMRLPEFVQKYAASVLEMMPRNPDRANFFERLRRLIRGIREPDGVFYDNLMSYISVDMARQMLSPDVVSKLDEYAYLPDLLQVDGDLLETLLILDQTTYMQGDLLTYSDRTAMRHSLEVRVPFCDRVVADFAKNIPQRYKIRHGRLKSVLKDSIKEFVPNEVLHRKKGGFRVPINEWLSKDLRPLIQEALNERKLKEQPFLNGEGVKRVIRNFYKGEHQLGFILWALLILGIWYEKDREPSAFRKRDFHQTVNRKHFANEIS